MYMYKRNLKCVLPYLHCAHLGHAVVQPWRARGPGEAREANTLQANSVNLNIGSNKLTNLVFPLFLIRKST